MSAFSPARNSIDVTELVHEFRAALEALAPALGRAGIAPGAGDSGDDFDHLAEALWEVFVRRRALRGEERLGTGLPRYGYPAAGAERAVYVSPAGNLTEAVFTEFDSLPEVTPGAFTTVVAQSAAGEGIVFPLSPQTRFVLVSRAGDVHPGV